MQVQNTFPGKIYGVLASMLIFLFMGCPSPDASGGGPTPGTETPQGISGDYTITFKPNAGTGTMIPQTYASGSSVTLSPGTFTKLNYTFAGWNTLSDSTGTNYSDGASFTMGYSNLVLYARWSGPYILSFYSNGGGGVMTTQTINTGAAITLPNNTFIQNNYTFQGWNTKPDGTGTDYPNGGSFTMGTANVSLFAKWSGAYSVSFNANGGIGSMSPQIIDTGTSANLINNTFTRAGYIFSGWNTQSDGKGKNYASGASFPMGYSSIILYAQWSGSYLLQFYSNGGTGTMDPLEGAAGAAIKVPQNSFSRTNYEFSVWNTKDDGTGTVYKAGDNFTLGTSSTYLCAQWIPGIVFDANGGDGAMVTKYLRPGAKADLPGNTLTRSGFTFAGWNTSADGLGTDYGDKASFTMPSASAITLFAKWTGPYTLTFDKNAAAATGTMAPLSMSSGVPDNLSSNNFTLIGYTFGGWNTKPDGSGTNYSDGASYTIGSANATLYAKWIGTYAIIFDKGIWLATGAMANQSATTGVPVTLSSNTFTRTDWQFGGWNTQVNGTGTAYSNGGSFTIGTANATLYAQWNPGIIFNANGGTGTMASVYGLTGAKVTLPAVAFTRTNYNFTGWTTWSDGSGTKYADGAEITLTYATTLYAQWVSSSGIAFNSNGGSGTMADLPLAQGASASLTLNSFTRSNYIFAGWNTSADGSGTSYGDGALFTMAGPSAVLYAQWTPSIYFSSNGGSGTMPNQGLAKGLKANLTPNTFTKVNYTFNGWNTSSDGTGVPYSDGALYLMSSNNTAYLYAQWLVNGISYKSNIPNDWNTMPDQIAAQGTAVTLSKNTFTRSNYSFVGWNTIPDRSGISYGDQASITVPSPNLTLYAQWNPQIIFSANGGTGTMENLPLAKGTKTNLPATTFTRAGYTFTGWNTQGNGTGIGYSDGSLITMGANPLVLYAQWLGNPCTITFDSGIGSAASPSTISGRIGTLYGPLPTTAYGDTSVRFCGWWTGTGGTGTQVTNNSTIEGTGNFTLYAKWSSGLYIQGDGSGGGGGGSGSNGKVGGNGGGNDDTILGSSGNDVIFGDGSGGGIGGRGVGYYNVGVPAALGGGGNDSINAGAGNDIIFGDGFHGEAGDPSARGATAVGSAGYGGLGGGGGGGTGSLGGVLGGKGGLGGGSGSGYAGSHGVLLPGFGNPGGTSVPGGNSAMDSLTFGFGGIAGGGDFAGGGGYGGAKGGAPNYPGENGDTNEHHSYDPSGIIFSYMQGQLANILTLFPGYGGGNDILDGGAGSDHLFGLGGMDIFKFDLNNAGASDTDTIWDFNISGTDKLRLLIGGTPIATAARDALIASQTTSGADRSIVFTDGAGKQVTIVVKKINRNLVSADFE